MAGQREGHVTFDHDEDADRAGRCGCCRRSEDGNSSSRCRCHPTSTCIHALLLFLALITGIGAGIGLRYAPPFSDSLTIPQRYLMYLYLPAELVIRVVHFMSIPLLVTSIISGIAGLTTAISAKVFLRGFLFCLGTSVLAAAEGLGLVYAVQPNRYVKSVRAGPAHDLQLTSTTVIDSFLDMIRNLFPNNFLTAGLELTSTRTEADTLDFGNNDSFTHETRWLVSNPGSNILGILFFAVVFGFGTTALTHRRRPLVLVADLFFEVVHSTYKGLVWLYPVMVFFMMVKEVLSIHNPVSQLHSTFVILLTILLGLFIHFLFILPLIYLLSARRNPYKVMWGSMRALFTALLTNDSLTTLPITIDCLEKLHIHPRVVRVIAPTGALINLDGFVIYQNIVIVFLAIRAGVNPTPEHLVALGFLTVAVSILAPAASKDIAILMATCKLLGLASLDTALLAPFHWLVSRFCTMTDVWGDCMAAGIIQITSQRDLFEVSNPNSVMNGELGGDGEQTLVDKNGCPVTNRYRPHQGPRDWTVRLVNEEGDRLVVSKV